MVQGVMFKAWLPQGEEGSIGYLSEGAQGKEQTHRILDVRDSVGVTLSCPKGLSLQLPTPSPVAALFPQSGEGLALLPRVGGGGHTRHLLAGSSIPVQLSLPWRPPPPRLPEPSPNVAFSKGPSS